MTDRFVALPVGQGDAFFYQRDDLKVLVDGGKSANKLPKLVNKHLRLQEIDILICTHNDADHAKGLIGILDKEKWKGSLQEVWLPGSWSYKLKELLEDSDIFFKELAENISQLPEEELSTLVNLSTLTNRIFEPAHQSEEINQELLIDICNNSREFTYTLYSPLLKILEPSLWLY